ncbi:hypothetical protein NPIL_472621 [Nephila pilipes]|uniref:Uncharacterized protein n=1 Tax=Nephila pilipes TaxID=299642 RepID=A0A8X6U9X9_NEPPI|nr:hypothetical protein NPIL_472621 [Nephila pilipes]
MPAKIGTISAVRRNGGKPEIPSFTIRNSSDKSRINLCMHIWKKKRAGSSAFQGCEKQMALLSIEQPLFPGVFSVMPFGFMAFWGRNIGATYFSGAVKYFNDNPAPYGLPHREAVTHFKYNVTLFPPSFPRYFH